jgi:hypothetical protein
MSAVSTEGEGAAQQHTQQITLTIWISKQYVFALSKRKPATDASRRSNESTIAREVGARASFGDKNTMKEKKIQHTPKNVVANKDYLLFA